VACSGATPLAITDCLNFGSPEAPDVMWQFVQAVEGMSEACKSLDTPVVSGNVSFYNQTDDVSVNPTPSVGAVGLLNDRTKLVSQFYQNEGDVIILLGRTLEEIGGSEYLSVIHDQERGTPPMVDLAREAALQKLLVKLADKRLVSSMHDISDGGLAVALTESALIPSGSKKLGFNISVDTDLRPDFFLFSETQSRVVVSLPAAKVGDALNLAAKESVPAEVIGAVTFMRSSVVVNGKETIKTSQKDLYEKWSAALPELMEE
jgi:phosphoribosylformylglycinamidine synthase